MIAERLEVGANRINESIALGSQDEANDAHNWQSQFQGESPGREVVKNDFGAEVKGDGDGFGLPGIQGCLQDPNIDRRKWRLRDESVGVANRPYRFQGDRWWNDDRFEQPRQGPKAIDLCQRNERTCVEYGDPASHHRLLAASSAANSSSV